MGLLFRDNWLKVGWLGLKYHSVQKYNDIWKA